MYPVHAGTIRKYLYFAHWEKDTVVSTVWDNYVRDSLHTFEMPLQRSMNIEMLFNCYLLKLSTSTKQ